MLRLADLATREDFQLGPLWVSPALRLIRGPAGETHVEPLIMQVFLLLADANGQVVTRERLYDECWGGVNVGEDSLNRAITMTRRIAAQTAPGSFTIESIPRTGYRLLVDGRAEQPATARTRTVAIGAALILGVLAIWCVIPSREVREPTVAVVAQNGASTELAHGISTAALTTAATYETVLQFLDGVDAGNARADFVLKVRDAFGGADRRIDLALVGGANQSLLWTWSGREPKARSGFLEQQARSVGASALTCAAETGTGSRPRPDHETVIIYVDACAKFEPWEGGQAALLPDAFEKVVQRAPQLRGAWAKLFLSKAEAIEGYPPIDLVGSLKQDLRNSQARGIIVPETYIARAAVLPLNARFERLQLYEAGLKRYPTNPFLIEFRSWQLRSVGRMDEAARTAARAVTLYPQSPAARTEFANSLMCSGRIDEARSVLEKGEEFSPGAPNLRGSRWRLEMRYGDPRIALQLARGGNAVVEGATISFLEARADPTKANIDRAIADLAADYRGNPLYPDGIVQALAAFGRSDEAIQVLLGYHFGANSGDGAEMLFRPHMRDVRRDRRFMRIAQEFGVTDYWLKSGILPDFCYDPGLPYECKAELAKLQKPSPQR